MHDLNRIQMEILQPQETATVPVEKRTVSLENGGHGQAELDKMYRIGGWFVDHADELCGPK